MSDSSSIYHRHAKRFAEQYNQLDFPSVHDSWKAHWPIKGDRVLDIGAGSGRDAKWMAEQGCEVFAVEPAEAMRHLGQENTKDRVSWLNDTLPSLNRVVSLGLRFDVILVSAVWMHIPPSSRQRAFRKLSNLLKTNGRLIIILRHGEFEDGRQAYPVSVEEVQQLAKNSALLVNHISQSDDSLKRDGVSWQTMVMSLPDDGSGDLNKIRHIIVNDRKSATYKLALLRTLLRIADAHPGAVIDRSDGRVAIPLGLVGLYWVRQFKRLIDKEQIQQNSNPSRGLSFIKPDGWGQISHLVPEDLSIGSLFFAEEAQALQRTLRDAISTITQNPVRFTYIGSKENRVFTVSRKAKRMQPTVQLDMAFLSSFGEFVLDESLWECMRLYHSWIEPLVVNQWVLEMQSYVLNQQRNLSLQTYHDSLAWIDKEHDTRPIRQRIDSLLATDHHLHSVWSGAKLSKNIHVDHCLPFTYWPNNDYWNLLPTTQKENLQKSSRVPSSRKLTSSKQRIVEWWELAWLSEPEYKQRFFTQAAFSLPNVSRHTEDCEEVFEAMGFQVRGLKSRLLINEWE
ncbi:MAG: class I SAM-dependent methyltransferase [Pseudomonadota bacterium]